MTNVPTIPARVTFKNKSSGGRQLPPTDSPTYRPHVVVGNRDQLEPLHASDGRTLIEDYLAVDFSGDGQVMDFDKEWVVHLRLWNEAADYSQLVPGASFTIREGGRIVGSGIVLDA